MKSKPTYSLVKETTEPFGREVVKSGLTCDAAIRLKSEADLNGSRSTYHVVPMRKLNNWKPVLRSLVNSLREFGFALAYVDDGEERHEVADNAKAAIEAMAGVDESKLVVAKDGQRYAVLIVLGNEPEETVCDYAVCDDLDKATEHFSKKWEGKSCPVKYEAQKWAK